MGVVELIYCYRGTFTFPPLFGLFQQRSQGSAAEIVRATAENKKNMAAKEEKLEKAPAWLVEAEARKKLNEQRRHPKSKEQGESETSLGPEKPVINGPALRSLPQKPEPGKDKSVIGSIGKKCT